MWKSEPDACGDSAVAAARGAAGVAHLAVREVEDGVGPIVEAVEDVRRVDDGDAAQGGLLLQECEERLAGREVEVGRHLVEEQEVRRAEELEEELGAAALAVGDLVQPPLEVETEERDQPREAPLDQVAVEAIADKGVDEARAHLRDL